MLLAKLKADGKFYAVKVLQKKVILKKKEVCVADYLFTAAWLDEDHVFTQEKENKIRWAFFSV